MLGFLFNRVRVKPRSITHTTWGSGPTSSCLGGGGGGGGLGCLPFLLQVSYFTTDGDLEDVGRPRRN